MSRRLFLKFLFAPFLGRIVQKYYSIVDDSASGWKIIAVPNEYLPDIKTCRIAAMNKCFLVADGDIERFRRNTWDPFVIEAIKKIK